MARGDHAHARLNTQLKRADKRCFIATACYGVDDPRTEALRQWRDRVLMPSHVGRGLVQLYYRLSPLLVRLCERYPALLTPVRGIVDRFHARITRGRS